MVVLAQGAPLASSQAPAAAPPARVVFDLVALDPTGRPLLDLTPDDLQVTVGGQPRAVRSLRFAYRGAGSELSARGRLTTAPSVAVPQRIVAVVVDENAIRRGREKTVASAAWRVIDSLTPTDMVGVMALPRPRAQTQLSVDRTPLRASLNGLVGRATEETMAAAAPTPTATTAQVIESEADITGPDQAEQARRQQAAEAEQRRNATDDLSTNSRRQAGIGNQAPISDAASPLGQSFRTLGLAMTQFKGMPGQKFVVYVTGGDAPSEEGARGSGEDLSALIDLAGQARVNVCVVLAAENARSRVPSALERLAKDTGGTVTTLAAKKPDLGDLTPTLASGYLVELEPAESDRVGRAAPLGVQTTRKGVRLVAASRVALREDPLPEPEAPNTTATETAAVIPTKPDGKPLRAGEVAAPDIELDAVLTRVASYVDTYLAQFGTVVAEEDYQQTVRRGATVTEARRTKADLLLVRSDNSWLPFRDVFEVNGKPVRDREERLKKLFLENPGQALAEGRKISDESARYNLGRVYRTINAPTIALSFFQSSFLKTFVFKRHGTENIDGSLVWRIDYREVGRPTQIVHGGTGADMPSTGAIYVEPTSGRVVRTVLQNGDASTVVEVIVKYKPNDSLGLWTPMQMTERYWSPGARGESISSDATYSAFRRFQVDTNEAVGQPK